MYKLQWGRNFIVAEMCPNKKQWVKGFMLQWGRNFIVAEIYHRTTRFGA